MTRKAFATGPAAASETWRYHAPQALQIFAIMKQRGLHRNTILYATLIKAPLVNERLQKDVWSLMRPDSKLQKQVTPTKGLSNAGQK